MISPGLTPHSAPRPVHGRRSPRPLDGGKSALGRARTTALSPAMAFARARGVPFARARMIARSVSHATTPSWRSRSFPPRPPGAVAEARARALLGEG
eukprot:7547202-Alexandrium_andersonii.AAC.1